MTEKTITKNMTFSEVLKRNPESIEVLFESGLHCIGCGMAASETLEEGCLAHGMNKKQIEDLIKKINKTK
jgi:hybrid cluster-associated redox disulfide protein